MKILLNGLSIIISLLVGFAVGTQYNTDKADIGKKPSLDTSQQATQLLSNNENCSCESPTTSNQYTSESSSPQTLPSLFLESLEKGQFEQAISLYLTVWQLSEQEALPLRDLLIGHAQSLLFERRYNQAEELINSYLSEFYSDLEFLLLSSQLLAETNLFYETINQLQLAYSYALTPSDQQLFFQVYKEISTKIYELLNQSQQTTELIQLYQQIDHAGLLLDEDRLRLIALYLQEREFILAMEEAEKIDTSSPSQGQLQNILSQHPEIAELKSSNTETNGSGISEGVSLTRVGDQFIAPLYISEKTVPLLIDTGASITTISLNFFEQIKNELRVSYQSQQEFLTANGKTTGEIYIVDQVKLGSHTLNNIELAVLDFPTDNSHYGLLGMNILRNFQFSIDQQQDRLNLTKISP